MKPNCKGCRWRPKSICRFESPQLEPNPFRILKQHLYPDDKYFCSHFNPLPEEKHCGNCEFCSSGQCKVEPYIDDVNAQVDNLTKACRYWKADWKEETNE